MRAVNIKEAKARLNELIDAATAGEQVVLMRGSRHVAAIVPITADDLELVTALSDAQAERFWQKLKEERTSATFPSARAAVRHLAGEVPAAEARAPKPRYGVARARPAKKEKGAAPKKAGR